VVFTVELVLIIWSTKTVMVVAAIVEHVLLQNIIRDVESTSAVSNRRVMKLAESAKNLLVQSSFNSAIVLFGFITCQSLKISVDKKP